MELIQIRKDQDVSGEIEIHLPASKSLSNRALIVAYLGGFIEQIENLSNAEDTQALLALLNTEEKSELYTGAGGTTFRFLLCLKAIGNWRGILGGTESFNRRPVKPLVDALIQLGVKIDYTEKDGFPPLRLNGFEFSGQNQLSLDAGISSQFVSALMLVAPYIPQGLTLHLQNDIVSAAYIHMTAKMMQHFGAALVLKAREITIQPGKYSAKSYFVENDWSSMAFFAEALVLGNSNIRLRFNDLSPNSWQGDARVLIHFKSFGIRTEWKNNTLILSKDHSSSLSNPCVFNLKEEPDLAPALIATSAACGRADHYIGLKTLRIKESDRISAMESEIAKLGFVLNCSSDEVTIIPGREILPENTLPLIETHEDHRIAMAIAPLAISSPMTIRDPEVVSKSFPDFWKELKKLGYSIEAILPTE